MPDIFANKLGRYCKIDPNFTEGKFFRGGPPNFWTCIIKFSHIQITRHSFTATGRKGSHILLCGESIKHHD